MARVRCSSALGLSFKFQGFAVALLLVLSSVASAQDTRNVTEPVVPRSCTTLAARPDSSEHQLDTTRLQQAIDHCKFGEAVELKADGANNVFLSGALDIRPGVTLLIDRGVTLFASRDPKAFDTGSGTCGTVDENGRGCRALINGDHADHAAVMGEGTIDGRGGETLIGRNVSWWDLAQQAKVTNKNQNCPRLIVLSHSNDFRLYKITLRNSPNFHVYFGQGDGFTAWGVTIDSPKTSRNTDGIDPGNATNVTITHCSIHAGDDNVAIKAGGEGASRNMTIAHNHFLTGHGMSIGSDTDAGVSHIRVTDLTIDGADNGIRIKSNSSRGGIVEDVLYQDVQIRNTKNPILMDTHYSFYGKDRDKLPAFRDIILRHVEIGGGGKITFDGYDAAHRLQMTLDGVTVADPVTISAQHADLTFGPGPVNLNVSGEDVQVKRH